MVYNMLTHFPLAKASHVDEPNMSGVGTDASPIEGTVSHAAMDEDI